MKYPLFIADSVDIILTYSQNISNKVHLAQPQNNIINNKWFTNQLQYIQHSLKEVLEFMEELVLENRFSVLL